MRGPMRRLLVLWWTAGCGLPETPPTCTHVFYADRDGDGHGDGSATATSV